MREEIGKGNQSNDSPEIPDRRTSCRHPRPPFGFDLSNHQCFMHYKTSVFYALQNINVLCITKHQCFMHYKNQCFMHNLDWAVVQFPSKVYRGFGYKEQRCELRSVKQFCGR